MTGPNLALPLMTRRAALLGAGGLLAGCVAADLAPRSSTPALLLPRSQAVLDRYVADGRLPGGTLAVRRGDQAQAFLQAGTLDYGAARAVDRDSLFRIYSMTKPITGTAAALLIEDGRLALDTPVADIVPELANPTVAVDPARGLDARPATRIMTVRHLLTHTSGLTYHIMGDGAVERAYRRAGIFPVTGYNLAPQPELDGPKVQDLDEMVRRLGEIPLLFEPGTRYAYGVSLDVLGLVIQRASGQTFPDFVQQRILDPIGMDDTVWRLRAGDAARFAAVYDYSGPERRLVDGSQGSPYAQPVTLYSGGAGLVSSTRDYLDFLTTLLSEGRAGRVRIMRPETARLIRSDILPQGVSADGTGYGFGGSVVRTVGTEAGAPAVGEFGWSGAAGTQGWIDPATGTAVVIMVQFFPYGTVPIVPELRAALAQDLAA